MTKMKGSINLSKYLAFILALSLLLVAVMGGPNAFLESCSIFGRNSQRAGNVNCTKLPDLEDHKANKECVNLYTIGCKLARIEQFCDQGITSFLSTGKCSPSDKVYDTDEVYYEDCCKMCARRKETFLKNGTCSEKGLSWAEHVEEQFLEPYLSKCCLDNANCTSSTTDELKCDCLEGFTKNGTQCVNIDECNDPDLNKCHECIDTPGSFECRCYDGYTLQVINNTKTCVKENKCKSPSFCDGICKKTENGHYTCQKCPNGPFQLDQEKEQCVPIGECKDPECDKCDLGFIKNSTTGLCENENQCLKVMNPCLGRFRSCKKLVGSYECACDEGFLWHEEEKRCLVNNKCKYLHMHKCHHFCRSLYWSYTCGCHRGYKMQADRKTCLDENQCNQKSVCDGIWEKSSESECHCKKCPNGLVVSYSEVNYLEKYNKTEECFPINPCKEPYVCPAGETCIELNDNDSTLQCVDLNCPEDYKMNEDRVCIKNDGVNDDRALAISKRLLRLPFKEMRDAPVRTIYRFNQTDCPGANEVDFKIENRPQKFMKKFQIRKENFVLVDQSISHDLLLLPRFEREQEFIIKLDISCKRKKMHTYKIHVFVI